MTADSSKHSASSETVALEGILQGMLEPHYHCETNPLQEPYGFRLTACLGNCLCSHQATPDRHIWCCRMALQGAILIMNMTRSSQLRCCPCTIILTVRAVGLLRKHCWPFPDDHRSSSSEAAPGAFKLQSSCYPSDASEYMLAVEVYAIYEAATFCLHTACLATPWQACTVLATTICSFLKIICLRRCYNMLAAQGVKSL